MSIRFAMKKQRHKIKKKRSHSVKMSQCMFQIKKKFAVNMMSYFLKNETERKKPITSRQFNLRKQNKFDWQIDHFVWLFGCLLNSKWHLFTKNEKKLDFIWLKKKITEQKWFGNKWNRNYCFKSPIGIICWCGFFFLSNGRASKPPFDRTNVV